MRELFGVGGTAPVAALGHFGWLMALALGLFPVPLNVFRHRLIN